MDSRWKAICTVGLILILLSSFNLFQMIRFQQNHLQEFIDLQVDDRNRLANFIQTQLFTRYSTRIKGFVEYRENIIAAFAQRDREKLLELTKPYYDLFKKENEFFFVLHFILPDDISFLRIHQPEMYGDDLTQIRPIVHAVNVERKQMVGFEVGRMGLFYRVIQPVFVGDEYIGGVEFGVHVNQLLKTLHMNTDNEEIALLVNKEEYGKTSLLEEGKRDCGPFVLLPGHNLFFRDISDLTCESQPVRIIKNGRVFHLTNDIDINDFQGNSIGKIILAKDITSHMDEMRRTIKVHVITSLAVLVFALLFLYFSFDALIKKVFNLNKSLKKSNENLELEVRQRTEELEIKIREREEVFNGLQEEIKQRHAVEKKLVEEKELLSITLRSIGDGIISTNINGRIVIMNNVAEKLTGWSHEEALGRELDEVFRVCNEQTMQVCENIVSQILQNGKMLTLHSCQCTLLVARDGTRKNIIDSGAPIRNKQGEIIGAIIVFRDVTEQKQMEEELLKTKQLESVATLAGGIAHDYNNILTAILGNINLAAMITGPDHEVHDMLKTAETASHRARDLTKQLLTFARGGSPVKQTVSLEEFIPKVIDFTISGTEIESVYKFADDLRPIDADRGQISQVIQNIVMNARLAMDESGTLTVTCENVDREASRALSLPEARYIKIAIHDTGKGIDPKNIDHIFDPYFSTQERSSHKGRGLGLAIAHSIIIQHGGFIRVESELGKGTTLTIFLQAGVIETDEKETGDGFDGQFKGKILIMDDEELVLDVAKMMLKHMGYEVVTCLDGRQMLDLYQKEMDSGRKFIAVILDLIIPGGMGGEKAARELLEIDPQAKAIVSSGYSNDPIMANYTDYGFSGVLSKPFQLDELWRALKMLDES